MRPLPPTLAWALDRAWDALERTDPSPRGPLWWAALVSILAVGIFSR